MPNPWIIIGVLIAFALAVSGAYLKGHSNGVEGERAAWKIEQAALDKKAGETLLAEKDKTADAERALAEHKASLEKDRAEKDAYIHGLRLAHGRLLDAHGGLYDKNGRPSQKSGGDGPGPRTGAVGGGDAPGVGCVLSGQTSVDLLDLARDAELDRQTALSCQADLTGTTAILNKLVKEQEREADPR